MLIVEIKKNCLIITLNNSNKGNCLTQAMLEELEKQLNQIDINKTQILIIKAVGKHFCTGVDLNWMLSGAKLEFNENMAQAKQLEYILSKLAALPVIKIAITQGSTLGAGIGIISCCDIVLANTSSQFKLPELDLGIIPALIFPYLVSKVGKSKAILYTLSRANISVTTALADNLVSVITNEPDKIIATLLTAPIVAIDCFNNYLNDRLHSSAWHLAKARVNNINLLVNKLTKTSS